MTTRLRKFGPTLKVESEPIHFSHRGQIETATLNDRGNIEMRYRGQRLDAYTLPGLVHQMEALDAEVAAKKARAAALAEAAASPIPAMDTRFQTIYVRGIDQRTRKALITDRYGVKKQTYQAHVLRVLSTDEQAYLSGLAQARDDFRAAIPTPPTPRDLTDDMPEDVPASYDSERDLLVAHYDGLEFTSSQGSHGLTTAIEQHYLAQRYAYTINYRDGIVATKDTDRISGSDPLFHSREEAEAYQAAQRAHTDAADAYQEALKEHGFDFSVLADKDED